MSQSSMSFAAHIRATLVLGLPLVGSSMAQMALHVVNTIMVGWYGVVPLAGLVIATSSFFILFILGTGFARAVTPLAANARAKGDEAELRRAARMGLWLSVGYALLIYPMFYFSEAILIALHQKPDVAAEAQRYLRIAGFGMIPALMVAVLQGWLAALERTQVVFWITLVAVFVNIATNWVLVFGNLGVAEMGVAGAGVSTLLVQVFSLIALALYAAKLPALRPYQLFRRFWRLDRPALVQVFRLGMPIGLTGLAEAGLFEASAIMMGWIGATSLAAHGIALEITALAFMAHLGLSYAATVRVAAAAGANDALAVRRAAWAALALSLGFAVAVITLFLSIPEAMISLFLDMQKPASAEILAFGALLLSVAALFQLADAMQAMALGLLRGIQDTKVPMWLATVSYWVIGIPSSYVLGFVFGYGGLGLWIGLVIGLVAASLSLMTRFWLLAPKPGVAGEAPL